LVEVRGHVEQIRSLALSPDGALLATGSEDKNVKVWDARTGQELQTLRGHPLAVLHVMFTADSKRLVSVSLDGTLKVWDSSGRRPANAGVARPQPVRTVTP